MTEPVASAALPASGPLAEPAPTRPRLLTLVDLAAIAVFAIVGARAGVAAGLDLFGLMVVAFASSLGGGMIRDVVIGDIPPAALRSVAYPVVAFCGGGAVFLFDRIFDELPLSVIETMDAAGLALFCVGGAAKALDHGLRPLAAVLLGTTSAVGGGMIRDVLVNDVPAVLVTDEYASAAVAGAAVMVVASVRDVRRSRAMLVGAASSFVLWVVTFRLGWALPRAVGG